MLPPSEPVPHWTLTLTLARIEGASSHRLLRTTLFKSRSLGDLMFLYHHIKNRLTALIGEAAKGGDN